MRRWEARSSSYWGMSIMNGYRTWRPEVRQRSHRGKEVAVSVVPCKARAPNTLKQLDIMVDFGGGVCGDSLPDPCPSVLCLAGYGALHAIEQGSTYNK